MSDELNHEQLAEMSDGAGAGEIVGALADSDVDGALLIEERKPLNRSTVVTFVVLLLGAGSVWFMYQRTGPSKAIANSKETVAAKQTINSFLSGGDENIKLMETMLRSTQKVVQQFLNYPSMTQIPLSDLRTNPFRLKPDRGETGQLSEAQERRRREEERLAALRAVQGLQLQSIMYGEQRRACMINGALYTETQQVDGFTIEKINQQSVVVKSGPYRFDLRMQR